MTPSQSKGQKGGADDGEDEEVVALDRKRALAEDVESDGDSVQDDGDKKKKNTKTRYDKKLEHAQKRKEKELKRKENKKRKLEQSDENHNSSSNNSSKEKSNSSSISSNINKTNKKMKVAEQGGKSKQPVQKEDEGAAGDASKGWGGFKRHRAKSKGK